MVLQSSPLKTSYLNNELAKHACTNMLIQIRFRQNEGSNSHLIAIVSGSLVNSGNHFNISKVLFMFGMFSLQLFERPQKPSNTYYKC